ncbi:hypothetical protein GLOIN_2v1495096 [Rhizophagus irregularis DAOM 181602=DAOM 197198]|nr:hypothetical protein GLOIN_2v1495096 [Rhizophagus irregularis DAOM 181602=DAOM 197198]
MFRSNTQILSINKFSPSENEASPAKDKIRSIIAMKQTPILYTIFTKDEMGDPFFCPANYPYTSHLIRIACQIRAANLLIMWISSALAFFIVIAALAISYCCCAGKDNCSSV